MADTIEFVSEQIANGNYHLSSRRKGKSFVWNVVAEILKPDDNIVAGFVYCRTCCKVLRYTRSQTSNLNRHKCCKNSKESQVLKPVTLLDKNEGIEKCTFWVIEDSLPFSAVNGTGFAKLAKFLIKIGATYGEHVDVANLLPDATTISRNAKKFAKEKKQELREEIKDIVSSGRASATIDMWTDNYVKRNFLGVTFHYAKDYKLFDIVLGMKSMDFEKSTGDNIARKLKTLFNEFGVEDISLIKFVTDRGKNIVKALEHNVRLNCSSHLLSNVLDKSFADTAELTHILESCKKIVKYFKKANLQHLLPTSLKSQCPTRWNSNYIMLKSICDNWVEIIRVLDGNEQGHRLLDINISIIRVLVELCKGFEIVFKKLQLSNSPSLCFVLPSVLKIKSLCEPSSEDMAPILILKERVNQNIDEIWVANLSLWHKAACFLYPPAINMQQNDLSVIKDFCIARLNREAFISEPTSAQFIDHEPTSLTTPPPSASQHLANQNTSDESIADFTSSILSPNNDAQFFFPHLFRQPSLIIEIPEDEVERYSKETVEITENFNVIEWWKENEKKFPHLSKLALQIHSLPASSAAAERSFSLAGNIISEKRNRLAPGSVDSLLFLNSYFKNFNA